MNDAVFLDLHGLGKRFSLFDQHFIGADVKLRQMVQRRFQRTVAAGAKQLADGLGQLLLPEQILDPAAGAVQCLGQTDQARCIAVQARGGSAAGTSHFFI